VPIAPWPKPGKPDCGKAGPGERLGGAARRGLREGTGLPIGLAGGVWLQDLVDRGEFVVVFAGWLAAGHDGVLSVEPAFAGHDRNLAEVAWREPQRRVPLTLRQRADVDHGAALAQVASQRQRMPLGAPERRPG